MKLVKIIDVYSLLNNLGFSFTIFFPTLFLPKIKDINNNIPPNIDSITHLSRLYLKKHAKRMSNNPFIIRDH